MTKPTTLEPGQLWKTSADDILLILRNSGSVNSGSVVANLTRCIYAGHFGETPRPGWTYLGMLTDKETT